MSNTHVPTRVCFIMIHSGAIDAFLRAMRNTARGVIHGRSFCSRAATMWWMSSQTPDEARALRAANFLDPDGPFYRRVAAVAGAVVLVAVMLRLTIGG